MSDKVKLQRNILTFLVYRFCFPEQLPGGSKNCWVCEIEHTFTTVTKNKPQKLVYKRHAVSVSIVSMVDPRSKIY